jgi:hypothetical protein
VSGVATAIVGSAIIGSQGAKKGAEAQAQSSEAAIKEQRRQFDIQNKQMQPWLQSGQGALGRMDQLLAGNMSGFQTDPGYQFALQEGMKGIDRRAAAGGKYASGGTLKDLMRYGQGMANQQYGDYWNRLAGMSGVGQTTGSQLGQLGAQTAGNIGNNMMAAGNARASGYQGMANAGQSALNNALFYSMMPKPGTPGAAGGT